MAEKTELLRWFEELVQARYGTMKGLAKVARRDAGALTRSASKTGSAGLEPLLRLAADVGESPSTVLRLAKKDDMDALIRRLYGEPSALLSADVQAVVDFLLSEDSRLAPLQKWMKTTAQDWRELLPGQTQNSELGVDKAEATPGRRSRIGDRKQTKKRSTRDDERP